jgi:gliding motility-associated-like protein
VITLDGSSILCDGQTTATLTSSYAVGNQWFLDGNPIVGETGNSIEVSEGGSYTVVVTSPEGCSATSAAQGITVKPVVPIDVTAVDTVVCNGEEVNIQLSATGGFVSYLWDVTGETTSSIVAINTGIFTVTGTTEDGCVSNASIQIINNSPFELNLSSPIFFDDFNVSAQGANDGSIDLTVFGGSGTFTYDWSNGGTTSDLSGLAGGLYTVTVTDEQGCAETDSIELKEPSAIKLPNGFTPNGDGFNDFYVIKGIQGYPGNKVNIFNRWGNLVFSTQDYQNNWDGLSNDGNLLPDGTYFIVVDLNKEGTDNVENYIDLRRN